MKRDVIFWSQAILLLTSYPVDADIQTRTSGYSISTIPLEHSIASTTMSELQSGGEPHPTFGVAARQSVLDAVVMARMKLRQFLDTPASPQLIDEAIASALPQQTSSSLSTTVNTFHQQGGTTRLSSMVISSLQAFADGITTSNNKIHTKEEGSEQYCQHQHRHHPLSDLTSFFTRHRLTPPQLLRYGGNILTQLSPRYHHVAVVLAAAILRVSKDEVMEVMQEVQDSSIVGEATKMMASSSSSSVPASHQAQFLQMRSSRMRMVGDADDTKTPGKEEEAGEADGEAGANNSPTVRSSSQPLLQHMRDHSASNPQPTAVTLLDSSQPPSSDVVPPEGSRVAFARNASGDSVAITVGRSGRSRNSDVGVGTTSDGVPPHAWKCAASCCLTFIIVFLIIVIISWSLINTSDELGLDKENSTLPKQ